MEKLTKHKLKSTSARDSIFLVGRGGAKLLCLNYHLEKKLYYIDLKIGPIPTTLILMYWFSIVKCVDLSFRTVKNNLKIDRKYNLRKDDHEFIFFVYKNSLICSVCFCMYTENLFWLINRKLTVSRILIWDNWNLSSLFLIKNTNK